jgi:hypothetical protein
MIENKNILYKNIFMSFYVRCKCNDNDFKKGCSTYILITFLKYF